jgi:hypothetical protein
MHAPSVALSAREPKVLLSICVVGLVAGSLDLTSAFTTYGWAPPRAIASGLLGREALHGSLAAWILGIFLRFLMAFSAAAVCCVSSWKLEFVVCGLFYGIAAFS